MHKKLYIGLLLGLAVWGTNTKSAEASTMAMVQCKTGNVLDVNINGFDMRSDVIVSNPEVVSLEEGVLRVIGEGNCVITSDDGYSFSLISSGSGDEHVVLNYTFDGANLNISGDSKEDIRVEKNSEIFLNDTGDIPESFQKSGENTYIPTEEGTFYTGDTVVKVYSPVLSNTKIVSSVGYSERLLVSDGLAVEGMESSDPSIVSVAEDGTVTLVGEGKATVTVNTGKNTVTCEVESYMPRINTEDVRVGRGKDYQMSVMGNYAGIPVQYSIVEGSAEVSESGLITNIQSDQVVVHVNIGGIEYDKRLIQSTEQDTKWDLMQPYIEECLGTPYVFGGVTPKVGLDCSGYVSYVYSSVGLISGRLTAQGLYDVTMRTEDPQPGDLVFFTGTYDAGCYITHVGIYAGDGMMYHSGKPNKKVSLHSSYYLNHLVGYGTMY